MIGNTNISFDNIILLASVLANIIIGIIVISKNRRSISNISFFLITFGLASWVLNNYLIDAYSDPFYSLIFARLTGTSICIFLIGLDLFSEHYGRKGATKITLINEVTVFLGTIFGIISALTSLVSSSADSTKYPVVVIHGLLYLPLIIFIFIIMILSFVRLFFRNKSALPAEKTQLSIVSTGLFLMAVISILTNVIAPGLLQNPTLTRIGPSTTIIFSALIAYTILRHRFFDIRVLIGRITYYLTLSLIPFASFFFFAWLYLTLFGNIFSTPVYLVSPFVAVLFVFAFNSLNNYIRNQVNSRLINPGYDPLTTAEKLSNELALIIDLPTIAGKVNEVIQKTIRPDFAAILVFPAADAVDAKYRLFHSLNREIADLDKLRTIVTTIWQGTGRYPLVLDELEDEVTHGVLRNMPNLVKELQPLMQTMGSKIILSIGDTDNIKGMYLMGQKEADYPYSTQDIDFLKSIANSGSLAIERSLLYGEVQEFANTLQHKVDVATVELKQANTELQATLGQLQEARRQERDMMDVMGHELRTPITIVRNALAMMNREKEKFGGKIQPDHLNKYLDMATESIRREITLIETLLSATKVDGSRMQLLLTKVDFTDVVGDGIEGQKAIAADKKVEVNYAPPANPIFVYADRTRIQEVMDNFLSNAVKYTLKGHVDIKIWAHEGFGWIAIKDTGIGIAEDDLVNLGKKFFRAKQYVNGNVAEGAKVVRPGGTGLGLYVTFDLIKIMGGELYINSKVGEGSTFTFCMPLYAEQQEQQYDETFDAEHPAEQKQHVHLNEVVPGMPA